MKNEIKNRIKYLQSKVSSMKIESVIDDLYNDSVYNEYIIQIHYLKRLLSNNDPKIISKEIRLNSIWSNNIKKECKNNDMHVDKLNSLMELKTIYDEHVVFLMNIKNNEKMDDKKQTIDKKYLLLIIMTILILGGVYLAVNGIGGWGWLIFFGLLIGNKTFY